MLATGAIAGAALPMPKQPMRELIRTGFGGYRPHTIDWQVGTRIHAVDKRCRIRRMFKPGSRRKLAVELRRRAWIVIVSILVVGGVAALVGSALPDKYTAEAVLVVRAGGPLAAQPDASTNLATTYATIIPLDARIRKAVEEKLPQAEEVDFTTTNDPNTAVLRLSFSAPSEEEAIKGANIVTRAIAGPDPVSETIASDSIGVSLLPDSASGSATATQLIAVGTVLGALLGFVLVAFSRSRDARVDELRELRKHVSCPCFEIHLGTATGLPPLANALADSEGGTTVVLPATKKGEPAADSLATGLKNTLKPKPVMRAAPPGSEDAGELAAAAADNSVLVIIPGERIVALQDAVDILGRYSAGPKFAALVIGKNGRRNADEPIIQEAKTGSINIAD
jgi:capsular polysaccharide biosynthesis protein